MSGLRKSDQIKLFASPQSPQTPKSPKSPHTPQSPVEVTETAAKLAFRSAADNPKSKTGRHLSQFSHNIKQKLATNEVKNNKSDGTNDNSNVNSTANLTAYANVDKSVESYNKTQTSYILQPLWELTTKLFSSQETNVIVENAEKSTNNDKSRYSQRFKEESNKLSERTINVRSEGIRMENLPSQRALQRRTSLDLSPQQSSQSPGSPHSPEAPQQITDKIDLLDWNHLAVELRKIQFSYRRKRTHKFGDLLQDVNMTVPKSSIYGLLGPSGCGKTTLLRLILGRIEPKSGTVKVNGQKPGGHNNTIPGIGVGFMPQELALHEEFTIREALQYFGTINGMDKEEIANRIKFLVDFLDLPEPERSIRKLSGGQKRRVSLSIALVHSPPLLILDEPTIGTDPVLRERIWEYLAVLSKFESITILITTHYIEEARKAHIVALMRSGKLLVEHSPDFLLRYFEVQNLVEVFLNVCRFDPNSCDYNIPANYINSHSDVGHMSGNKPSQHLSNDELNNSRINLIKDNIKARNKVEISLESKALKSNRNERLKALIYKNYIRLIRNIPLLAFQLMLPSICIILFCVCIGIKPSNLKIALFNEEFENILPRLTGNTFMSVFFMKAIDNKTIVFKNYDSKETAIQSVKDSHTFGALIIPRNFTPALIRRFLALTFTATDDDIKKSTIHYFGDFTDRFISEAITKALGEAEQKFKYDLIDMWLTTDNSSVPVNPRTIDHLVHFNDPPVYGSLEPKFRDLMSPGIILTITYILAVGLTSLSFVVERKEGLLERTVVSGVKIHEILISQVIVQFVILMFQTFFIMIFIFFVFRIPNKGSYIMIVVMILLQGLTGMSFGVVISAICSDEQSAIMLALGSFYPYSILSGIIWPLEGMPYTLRQFSYFLPQTLPILSLRNIVLKGWTILYTYVWLGYVSTITWILVFVLTAGTIGAIRKYPTI